MKEKNNYIIYAVLLLFATGAFGVRCARQSTPVGGPKDTIPPIVKSMSPNNYSRNLRPKEIVFEFNEFMQIKDAQNEVMFSPKMDARPTVELKGRKIITKFNTNITLDSNTTYVIDYGRALQDINEGNAARQLKYVFSTGYSIDSLTMSGQAVDAGTGDTLINALVFLYDQIPDSVTLDSTLYNGKVRGMYNTDSLGVYFATHLKDKDYRVYIIVDEDKNKVYTPGKDKVGFLDNGINPANLEPFKIWFDPISRQVYASPQVKVRLFKEQSFMPQRIEEVKMSGEGKVLVRFATTDAKYDKFKIEGIPDENLILMPSPRRDSLVVWIKSNGIIVPDTLRGRFDYNGRDTLGRPAVVEYKFETTLPLAEQKSEKAAVRSGVKKESFWQRLINWFRFRHNSRQKKAHKALLIKQAHILDSLKNDPEALLRLKIDSLRRDSIRLDSVRLDSLHQDSLLRFKLDSLSKLKLYIDPQSNFNPKNSIYIRTDFPLDSIVKDSIRLYKYAKKQQGEDHFDVKQSNTGSAAREKSEVAFRFERDSMNFLKQKIISDWMPDVDYEFVIKKRAFIDINGKSNDTIRHKFSTVATRKTTKLEIKTIGVEGCYIMDVVSDRGGVESSHIVKSDTVFVSALLPVGKYKIRITKDDNCNGKFDDGNLIKRRMPEEIDFYRNEKGNVLIETKENFDFNFTIDFSKLFDRVAKSVVLSIAENVPNDNKGVNE